MADRVKKSVPRFVLMLQDTQTEIDGPNGKQYYSIQIGFNSKQHLLKAESSLDGRNELLNVIDTFFNSVYELGKRKGGETKSFTAVEVKTDNSKHKGEVK